MEKLSVNVVLDDLIRQLRKEARRRNNAPVDYQNYFADGFRHAVDMVNDYRNKTIEKNSQLRYKD